MKPVAPVTSTVRRFASADTSSSGVAGTSRRGARRGREIAQPEQRDADRRERRHDAPGAMETGTSAVGRPAQSTSSGTTSTRIAP